MYFYRQRQEAGVDLSIYLQHFFYKMNFVMVDIQEMQTAISNQEEIELTALEAMAEELDYLYSLLGK
jgi:hypothetical protein